MSRNYGPNYPAGGDDGGGEGGGDMLSTNNLSDVASVSAARTNLGLGSAATRPASAFLQPSNNLSDVGSTATARTNLGLGTAATHAASDFAQTANNLSDLASAATARTNLGLGTAATHPTSDFLQPANNLSDVGSASTARTNLGLGTMATQAASAVAITGGSITGMSAPTNSSDVATKGYVDAHAGGGGFTLPTAPGFDQYDSPGVGNIFSDQVGWSYRTNAGSSAPDGAVAAAGIPGAVRCKTVASTAFSDVYKNTDSIVFLGSGTWRHSCTIALDTLPNTSTLAFWAGFRDNSGYGAYFWGDSHANIQCVTEDASGTVITDSGVPWVATVGGTDGNYVTLEVVVEAGVATFTITPLGGSPTVKTISTNIPTTALQQHVFHVQPLASIAVVNVYLAYERLRWDP